MPVLYTLAGKALVWPHQVPKTRVNRTTFPGLGSH